MNILKFATGKNHFWQNKYHFNFTIYVYPCVSLSVGIGFPNHIQPGVGDVGVGVEGRGVVTVQSAQPYYVSFSLANEERINFLASSALFPRSFHALSTIISRLSHATNPTATRNVKFACHSIVPRSPRATGKIASRYPLQPIATCLHFILDQYRIRSSDPNVFTRVR